MKYFFLHNCFLLLGLSLFSKTSYDPLLVIVLMVKNEQAAMSPTLQPFLEAGIDSYLILDTGSTDNTIKVTQDLFTTYTVSHGYIIEKPFVDFSTSRNTALECAEEKFPNAAFFLMIDAEWILHNVPDLIQFSREQIHSTINSYLIRIVTEQDTYFFVQRLIRPHKGFSYSGVVHEVLNPATTHKSPETIFFTLSNTHYGLEKSKKRWLHDCELLKGNLEKNPYDAHALYYLGQTYDVLGDYKNTLNYYELFCSIATPDEFNFMAHCRLAELYRQKKIYYKTLYHYLEAYNIKPNRAEPLVGLAHYYLNQEQFATSFLFASKALQIPYPDNNLLLIDKNIYSYLRFDILAEAAWQMGKEDISESALRQALKAHPEMQHLQHNLTLLLENKTSRKDI